MRFFGRGAKVLGPQRNPTSLSRQRPSFVTFDFRAGTRQSLAKLSLEALVRSGTPRQSVSLVRPQVSTEFSLLNFPKSSVESFRSLAGARCRLGRVEIKDDEFLTADPHRAPSGNSIVTSMALSSWFEKLAKGAPTHPPSLPASLSSSSAQPWTPGCDVWRLAA